MCLLMVIQMSKSSDLNFIWNNSKMKISRMSIDESRSGGKYTHSGRDRRSKRGWENAHRCSCKKVSPTQYILLRSLFSFRNFKLAVPLCEPFPVVWIPFVCRLFNSGIHSWHSYHKRNVLKTHQCAAFSIIFRESSSIDTPRFLLSFYLFPLLVAVQFDACADRAEKIFAHNG